MSKEKENKTVRVNMTMSREIVDFFQEMSDRMGIPRSTCMVIGLMSYIDQQKMFNVTSKLPVDFNR